jgi:hypothetical protein
MSDSTKDPVEWVRTDKFVMPVIPDELHVDPRTLAILHCVSFLELSGDDTVDPDWAVEAMEHVAHYLQRLSSDDLTRMTVDMQTIASWAESHQLPPHFIDLVQRFTEYAGLETDE